MHADAQQLLLAAAERVLRQAAVQRLVRVLRAQAHGQVGLQRLRRPARLCRLGICDNGAAEPVTTVGCAKDGRSACIIDILQPQTRSGPPSHSLMREVGRACSHGRPAQACRVR